MGREQRCAWYALPAYAGHSHTNHHSTLIHLPAHPSLPLADFPPPLHVIQTPSHSVEAPTTIPFLPHPASPPIACAHRANRPRFPRAAGHWRWASLTPETYPTPSSSSREAAHFMSRSRKRGTILIATQAYWTAARVADVLASLNAPDCTFGHVRCVVAKKDITAVSPPQSVTRSKE